MTYAEVITQVKQLPPAERILLVETILRWMREELAEAGVQDRAELRRQRLQAIPPASALRGIAKPTGPMPTDQEIKDDYINYLEQKYS